MNRIVFGALVVLVVGSSVAVAGCSESGLHTIDESNKPSCCTVSLSEPSTGDVFSGMGYVSTSSAVLIYHIPNASESGSVSSIRAIAEDHKQYSVNGSFYEDYARLTLSFPLESDEDKTFNYHIVAKNESGAIVDSINATVRRDS